MAVISNVQYKSEGAIPIQIDHPTFPGAETGIIEEAKTNPKAFGQLYELHYSAILSYIFHRTLNRSIAEDLTSNTFFKALKALAGYKPNAPFRAWLYRIASNEIRNHFRKVKRRRTREESYHLMEWQNELNTVYFPKLEIEAEENKKRTNGELCSTSRFPAAAAGPLSIRHHASLFRASVLSGDRRRAWKADRNCEIPAPSGFKTAAKTDG